MHTLLMCADVQFLGVTRAVLNQLRVTPEVVGECDAAMARIEGDAFDLIVVDWREIDHPGEFLGTVRRSKLNADCVLVAIVRDLLDLRQAFAAGVDFLIHKPASTVQIERCLRAAYCARVARRRRHHREAVQIPAAVSTRTQLHGEATIVNLSEAGAGLKLESANRLTASWSAGEEVELRFSLSGADEPLHATGRVIWKTGTHCGIRFSYIPENERSLLCDWLTDCVERSLAEVSERMRGVCA